MGRFEDNLRYGNEIQEKIIEFLGKYWNLEFLSGERNGITVNTDEIEKLFNCKYIPPVGGVHGAMLRFVDYDKEEEVDFIMPDELFIHRKSKNLVWVESKGRRGEKLYEKKSKIDDYFAVRKYGGSTVYIIFAVEIQNSGRYDLYSQRIENLPSETFTDGRGNECYLYNIENMKKLNTYPV